MDVTSEADSSDVGERTEKHATYVKAKSTFMRALRFFGNSVLLESKCLKQTFSLLVKRFWWSKEPNVVKCTLGPNRPILEIVQPLYLILHQRLERLKDKACARAEEDWHLEAERLATAGWPDGQHVLASKGRQDDWQLTVPQPLLAENLEHRAEVDLRRGEFVAEVKHPCQPNGPSLDHPSREADLQVQVQCRMTAVAQRDQIRCAVVNPDRPGHSMMHIQFGTIGRPTLSTAISVAHQGGESCGRP